MNVSIILPVHGDCPYLPSTLESIQNQTFSGSIQIILCLDRPSSEAMKVIGLFCDQNEVTVIECTKPGISHALNQGISASIHPLLARIDSDDLMHKDRIAKQVDFMLANPDVMVLGSQMEIINSANMPIGRTYYPTRDKDLRNLLRYRNCIGHPSVMFRRSMIEVVGDFKVCFEPAEDYDLWSRVYLRQEFKFYNLPEQLTSYRRHDKQVSATKLRAQIEKSFLVSENIRNLSNQHIATQMPPRLSPILRIISRALISLRVKISTSGSSRSVTFFSSLLIYSVFRPKEMYFILKARGRR